MHDQRLLHMEVMQDTRLSLRLKDLLRPVTRGKKKRFLHEKVMQDQRLLQIQVMRRMGEVELGGTWKDTWRLRVSAEDLEARWDLVTALQVSLVTWKALSWMGGGVRSRG